MTKTKPSKGDKATPKIIPSRLQETFIMIIIAAVLIFFAPTSIVCATPIKNETETTQISGSWSEDTYSTPLTAGPKAHTAGYTTGHPDPVALSGTSGEQDSSSKHSKHNEDVEKMTPAVRAAVHQWASSFQINVLPKEPDENRLRPPPMLMGTKNVRLTKGQKNDKQDTFARNWPPSFSGDLAHRAATLVEYWRGKGVKVVAFDFDGTFVATQVGGGIYQDDPLKYTLTPTRDAEALVKAITRLGSSTMAVWIASFQDAGPTNNVASGPGRFLPLRVKKKDRVVEVRSYWPTRVKPVREYGNTAAAHGHIVGPALMGRTIANSDIGKPFTIKVVAFYPPNYYPSRKEYTYGMSKVLHLEQIAKVEGIHPHEILLVDDLMENVAKVIQFGFLGVHVSKGKGIVIPELRPPTFSESNFSWNSSPFL